MNVRNHEGCYEYRNFINDDILKKGGGGRTGVP